jgi:hypothetical protein
MGVVQLMKSRKAFGEATDPIRIPSTDEGGIESVRLDTIDAPHEESRRLISDDYNERAALGLENPRRSMENV